MPMLKIALVQKKAVPNQKATNLKLALQHIKEAANQGADLVLFPEMWSNGYATPFDEAFDKPLQPNFTDERTNWLDNGVELNSAYIMALKKHAKEYQVDICATYLSKIAKKRQNTAIMIDRNGEIILDYAKVHTCDFSLERLLQHGTEFKVCEFDGIKLGVMICFDREFPESARELMLNGAEIILVPNACDMNPARINQLSTRAFENMVGVAMANYPGNNWGQSCAFSPIVFDNYGNYLDNVIVQADDVSEAIYIAEFDLEAIRNFREVEVWGNAYRKPETYTTLVNPEVNKPFIRND
ncbi:carbon-nitrogen hydrolase family protein [Listeria ivanovii]|nr:carbon-nitrogen hydrolase family protein [Listeria ivanovii]AHI56261.1 hydrolase [Listeria ivanovii WSLC3009]MBC1760702.1 carbon-nitrogen hydrolase family protein [Listeria ivanovii]MCJ1718494.1 carbon-nitrogen hydrolase family protein [Listeria ivanovii]MCJ1723685.1 carbon-nitrogen hydrolase family protein [Listeria ivanovii]MCJ1736342.1 carbon-nitrogen hydrolase family protein [Listeria ivanovii]